LSLSGTSEECTYRFDGVTVDIANFRVSRNGSTVTLTPRAFDVLRVLLHNSGTVVERRELFDEVWKDTFVTDNALSKVIKELRHALSDSADAPHYIETIPKRGYRFIGTLEPIHTNGVSGPAATITDGDYQDPDGAATKRSAVPVKIVGVLVLISLTAASAWFLLRPNSPQMPATIAVLPFKPLNGDGRDESLEMGMADTLITRLSAIREIVVRPISAVRKYEGPDQDPVEAGRALETEAVLDGSIQRAGERVRVTARLIDVRTGATLWAETFDENFTDIFRVQDSISERITNALAIKLSNQEKEQLAKHYTESPEAYEAYLQGQFLWNRRGVEWIKLSLQSYQLALEKDPDFALAHIGAADAYIMLSGHRKLSMDEAEANAEPHILRALEIDNRLAQAHNALAELKYQYKYDWAGAEAEFKTAIELNPNIAWTRQAYGWYLMSQGRFNEAEAEMERARQLDPSSLTMSVARGRLYYYSRRYEKAAQHFQNVLALEPTDGGSYLALYNIYEQKQMYPEALETFLKVRSLAQRPKEEEEEFREAFRTGGWEGFLRQLLAETEMRAAEKQQQPAQRYADLYARLGDKDRAFFWFEKVFEARDVSILQFKIEPAYDLLRDDPRYTTLLRRIGQEP
jgi:TolB-like protein/DNA-binding winged helix-turn-helix (wHTH) protein/Tfp pilus assembly protein PilF